LKNLLAAALGATTLVIGATAAAADPVQWTLPDLTLVDGGTISGTFTYDSDTATFSKIQVNTSGGALAGVGYTRAQGGSEWSVPTWVVLRSSAPDSEMVRIILADPMTNAGGTIAVSSVHEGTCSEACTGGFPTMRFSHTTGAISGSPAAAPAPIPTLSEWAMILLGVMLAGGAAFMIQRRRTV